MNAPSVEKYDLRARYGAYVPGEITICPKGAVSEELTPVFKRDIIRFSVEEDSSVPAPSGVVRINIIESATDSFAYDQMPSLLMFFYEQHERPYASALNKLGGSADSAVGARLTLKAGVEYIASVAAGLSGATMRSDGRLGISSIAMMPDEYGADRYVSYSARYGEQLVYDAAEGQPFWLMEYADIEADEALSSYYEKAKEAYYISARSFGVMATEDILGVPAFHLGSAFIKDGRVFTKEEYEQGARACLISGDVARAQGWNVGDKIDMSLYEFECFLNDTRRYAELTPAYNKDTEGFFDQGEYEVVGIYELRPVTGVSTVSESALSVPWNTIFLPKKSILNAPNDKTQPVSGALMTLWLKNGSIGQFVEAMDAQGITEQRSAGYEARFTFYDQGYSKIQPSLIALSGTAELLLILSSSLLVCAAVLLAFFYALSKKQELGIMRLLGCGKTKALFTLIGSGVFIAAIGTLAGAALGHGLTRMVGESILSRAANVPESHLAYSAYIAAEQSVEIHFALGPELPATLLAFLAGFGLFMLLCCAFSLRYLAKEPRALLPQGHE